MNAAEHGNVPTVPGLSQLGAETGGSLRSQIGELTFIETLSPNHK